MRQRSPGALLGSVVFQGGLVDEAECTSTVSRDVELDEVLEVLDVRRQSLDLVVAQPKLAKSVETEEILIWFCISSGTTESEQWRLSTYST